MLVTKMLTNCGNFYIKFFLKIQNITTRAIGLEIDPIDRNRR